MGLRDETVFDAKSHGAVAPPTPPERANDPAASSSTRSISCDTDYSTDQTRSDSGYDASGNSLTKDEGVEIREDHGVDSPSTQPVPHQRSGGDSIQSDTGSTVATPMNPDLDEKRKKSRESTQRWRARWKAQTGKGPPANPERKGPRVLDADGKPRGRGRPRKYFTEEERKAALRKYAMTYYQTKYKNQRQEQGTQAKTTSEDAAYEEAEESCSDTIVVSTTPKAP